MKNRDWKLDAMKTRTKFVDKNVSQGFKCYHLERFSKIRSYTEYKYIVTSDFLSLTFLSSQIVEGWLLKFVQLAN